MSTVVFAFIHHLALLILFACLFCEHLLLKPNIDPGAMRTLIKVDLIYGISAVVLIMAGILRVMYFEKGLDYYLYNWAFLLKIGLFIFAGILSILPTSVFLRWRKHLQKSQIPELDNKRLKMMIMIIRAELLLMVLILPLAALMAKGFGHMG